MAIFATIEKKRPRARKFELTTKEQYRLFCREIYCQGFCPELEVKKEEVVTRRSERVENKEWRNMKKKKKRQREDRGIRVE